MSPIIAHRGGHAYYPGIDGLRAIAILLVLICHVDDKWLRGGFIGVDIFFVISGFVVTASVSRLRPKRISELLALFYSRRIVRIAPALAVCLVVTGVFTALFIPSAWLSQTNHKTGIAAFFGLSNFLLAATSNDYFSPRADFNPFTHTWSLGVEEQFYLLVPAIYFWWVGPRSWRLRPMRVIAMIAVLSALSLLCCAMWSVSRPQYAFYLMPARFWELGAGMILFLTKEQWEPFLARVPLRTITLAYAFSLLLICLALRESFPPRFPFPWAMASVVATAVLIALLVSRADAWIAGLFSNILARAIGKISYSLYLWHWPVLVLFRWTVGLESGTCKFIAVVLSTLLAIASYHWVERPLRQSAGLKLQPRARVVAAGLAMLTVLAGCTLLAFRAEPYVSLSVTRDHAIWDPYPEATSTRQAGCRVIPRVEAFGAGTVSIYDPLDCTPSGIGRLIVAGDSHAGAYSTLLKSFALRTGTQVRLYSMAGCAFFSLSFANAVASEGCAPFSKLLIRELDHSASRDDVLFLPSLRERRYLDQWGAIESSAPSPGGTFQERRRAQAIEEAVTELGQIASHGTRVIFEAPTPLFKSPPFRCADWFNAGNAVCKSGFAMSQAELEGRRQSALSAMRQIVAQIPNAYIWDPLPILCPADPCNAFDHGVPLFFDGDHLSGYGNQVLLTPFTNFVLRTANRTPNQTSLGYTLLPAEHLQQLNKHDG